MSCVYFKLVGTDFPMFLVPMNILVQTIPALNAAMACLYRIEFFLKSDARQDHRLPLFEAAEGDEQSSFQSTDGIELQNLGPHPATDLFTPMIVTHHASFAWSIGGESVVTDVSFNVQRHQLCFIIGPVGSGKSTLLKGLLGETPSFQGFVYSNAPGTGFVDQTPWVRNGTIQANILGISSFEEPWYSQVVHACGLETDIAIMPKSHGKYTIM